MPRKSWPWAASALLRAGTAIFAVMAVFGLGAPWLAPYDPSEQPDGIAGQYRPPLTVMAAVQLDHGGWLLADRVERRPEGLLVDRLGTTELLPLERVRNLDGDGVRDRRIFLMGSDKYSRDVFSRWLYAARLSLLIAILALVLSLTVGIAAGALAALGGPILDSVLMRLVDGLISFPWLFLIITLTALFNAGTWSLVLLLGFTGWMSVARLTRAELLGLRQREFVQAARGLGAGEVRIFFRHLLPNALTPLVVEGTLRIGRLILIEASLSFLGFGVQPPDASWGNMIAEGRGAMLSAWWVSTFPALALIITVIGFGLLSDGLRDDLDPRRESA
ncbi:MAG: ABC transporter permease [Thermoanaerobaculia bacterium]